MYTFVPLTSLALLIFLGFSPAMFWRSGLKEPRKHPPFFPSPIPELLLSASLWSFAYLLRIPLYAFVSFVLQRFYQVYSLLTFNVVYVVIYNLLRLSSLPILRLREELQHSRPTWRDGIFERVWWLSLGWATVDVTAGIVQSYTQIALYRNVMVPEERIAEVLADGSGIESHTPHLVTATQEVLPLSSRQEGPKPGPQSPRSLDEAIRLAVDQDLEQLMNLKEREDVEEVYGVPVIVSCFARPHPIITSNAYHRSRLENPRVRLVFATRRLDSAIGWPHSHSLRVLSTFCCVKSCWRVCFAWSTVIKKQALFRCFPPRTAAQSVSEHLTYPSRFASHRRPHRSLC